VERGAGGAAERVRVHYDVGGVEGGGAPSAEGEAFGTDRDFICVLLCC
jgi:hypothetical protein